MNKQQIENSIEVITIIHDHIDLECDLNKDLDECFPTIISALTQQLTNGWIPCKERLPKEDEEVLITTWNKQVEKAWLYLGQWCTAYSTYPAENEFGYVIAWQPLPTSYKEDAE